MTTEPDPKLPRREGRIKTLMTLDAETLDGLDAIVAADPDVQSRSAAVRKLVRLAVKRLPKRR